MPVTASYELSSTLRILSVSFCVLYQASGLMLRRRSSIRQAVFCVTFNRPASHVLLSASAQVLSSSNVVSH